MENIKKYNTLNNGIEVCYVKGHITKEEMEYYKECLDKLVK